VKNGLDPQENLSQELVPEALGDADSIGRIVGRRSSSRPSTYLRSVGARSYAGSFSSSSQARAMCSRRAASRSLSPSFTFPPGNSHNPP
jgi:hypothetical protein